jgi:hypothetical protein
MSKKSNVKHLGIGVHIAQIAYKMASELQYCLFDPCLNLAASLPDSHAINFASPHLCPLHLWKFCL